MQTKNYLLLSSLMLAIQPVFANAIYQFWNDGQPYLDARYRYEWVEQSGLSENANASTLSTKLGFTSGSYNGFSGNFEVQNVAKIFSGHYNDTINGLRQYPIVADVESTEINQLFLQYEGLLNSQIKIGRSRIDLDNQRFIGAVAWRQNDQTFDAVSFKSSFTENITLQYIYIDGVNRIFSHRSPNGRWESTSHALNVCFEKFWFDKITAYAYILDFKLDAPVASSSTYGLSITDSYPLVENNLTLKYLIEFARQTDHGTNPIQYNANYFHFAPAIAWKNFTATVGYEVLGTYKGIIGFSTPLATQHKFNGWADKFLNTPANGLNDLYVDLTYLFKDYCGHLAYINGLLLKAQYHSYTSKIGNQHYGDEYGIYSKLPIKKKYFAEIKYAHYIAEDFATDTNKLIFGIGLHLS